MKESNYTATPPKDVIVLKEPFFLLLKLECHRQRSHFHFVAWERALTILTKLQISESNSDLQTANQV